MGILLFGRSACGVVGTMLVGPLANRSLFTQLLALALCQVVLLVGQVMSLECSEQAAMSIFLMCNVYV